MDGRGIAVIDIAIETLIDLDALAIGALPDLGDEAPRRGFHDLADHTVLDAERALVAEENNLVADGETAFAVLGPEGVSRLEQTALDQLAAHHVVEGSNVTAQMRQDQRGLCWIVVAVPVRDQVFDRLREAILSLELTPGTTLSRTTLATQFGVSSTPIRDALMRLEEEGLVEVFPQHATVVSPIDLTLAHQAHFLRRSLELEIVRSLALSPDPRLIARLGEFERALLVPAMPPPAVRAAVEACGIAIHTYELGEDEGDVRFSPEFRRRCGARHAA